MQKAFNAFSKNIGILSSLTPSGTSEDFSSAKLNFLLKVAYYQKPLLKCLMHKDGLLKSNFKLVRQEYVN